MIPNATWDAQEHQWKAIKIHDIYTLRKWFDRRFDSRLASKLTDLGYSIETKQKADPKGGKRYYSWDVKGIPQSVIQKFSRRTAEVEKLAGELGIENPRSKDKLGATSRLHKREDMTLEDYREYWSSRLTDKEKADIVKAIRTAHAGMNPAPENTAEKAVEYAIRHQFYRNRVVPVTDLEITAMERCMGAALPEDIRPEAIRQGLLVKDGDATTKEVLAQEGRIIDFAQEGKGTMRPLGSYPVKTPQSAILSAEQQAILKSTDQPHDKTDERAGRANKHSAIGLSTEQQAAIRHVWNSPDQVILIRGGAGTGKTTMMKAAIAGIDKPVAVLAPSSNASRTVLREEGFQDANTVQSFLDDEKWQARIKGGVIWVDEAGLLPVQDLDRLSAIAKDLDARIVLQGDHKQHKSAMARHGNMFRVLQEYAGLKLAELKDIKRQKGLYKEAIDAIQKGDILKGP